MQYPFGFDMFWPTKPLQKPTSYPTKSYPTGLDPPTYPKWQSRIKGNMFPPPPKKKKKSLKDLEREDVQACENGAPPISGDSGLKAGRLVGEKASRQSGNCIRRGRSEERGLEVIRGHQVVVYVCSWSFGVVFGSWFFASYFVGFCQSTSGGAYSWLQALMQRSTTPLCC